MVQTFEKTQFVYKCLHISKGLMLQTLFDVGYIQAIYKLFSTAEQSAAAIQYCLLMHSYMYTLLGMHFSLFRLS